MKRNQNRQRNKKGGHFHIRPKCIAIKIMLAYLVNSKVYGKCV